MKAVIFDYGNVLSLDQKPEVYDEFAGLLGLPAANVRQTYWRHRLDYDRDSLDTAQFWRAVAGRDVGPETLQTLLTCDARSWSRPNTFMLDTVRDAANRGFRTALLSNMPADVWTHLSRLDWLPRFHHITISGHLGLVKPDADIYLQCLAGLGVPASETVFVDDRIENIEAAGRLGIDARLYSGGIFRF